MLPRGAACQPRRLSGSAASRHSGSSSIGVQHRRTRPQRRAAPAAAAAARALEPVEAAVSAFAPATVANLGPGFDWLGCAVEGQGDVVTAEALPGGRAGEVSILGIDGDGGRLSLVAADNCCGIAAAEALRLMGAAGFGPPPCGVGLRLRKGLPLGSGMGSSAASAAAAAVAVNALFGSPLPKESLVLAGLESEAAVSGRHADNIAPCILGGFVLVRGAEPLALRRLAMPPAGVAALRFVLVAPRFEAPTAKMRAALRPEVPMKAAVANCAAGGELVAAILTGDVPALGAALGSDVIVEPARGPLIPGFAAVKAAALAAGAYGCTISGAGPTCVAVVDDEAVGRRVAAAMVAAFGDAGGLEANYADVVRLDVEGARVVKGG